MNVKKCSVCNKDIDEDSCKKDRNVCKICYNINRKKYINNEKKKKYDGSMNNIEKTKFDTVKNKTNVSIFEDHACVVIGPRNVGKTF